MDTTLIARLLQEHIRANGLSARAAARQAGVAHTTILRLLEGRRVGLDTLVAISDWLNIDPALVTASLEGDGLAVKLALLLQAEPLLAEALADAVARIEAGELKPDAVQDILRYISFRLSS